MKLVICLPSRNYNNIFLKSWVNFITSLERNKISYTISEGDSCNKFYAKTMTLGGSVMRGKHQKPFNDKLNYTHLLFLDGKVNINSTNLFDFIQYPPIQQSHIVSCYNPNNVGPIIEETKAIIDTEYLNLDCCLFKFGVLESLEYPWFTPPPLLSKEQSRFYDYNICNSLRQKNFKILISKEHPYELF